MARNTLMNRSRFSFDCFAFLKLILLCMNQRIHSPFFRFLAFQSVSERIRISPHGIMQKNKRKAKKWRKRHGRLLNNWRCSFFTMLSTGEKNNSKRNEQLWNRERERGYKVSSHGGNRKSCVRVCVWLCVCMIVCYGRGGEKNNEAWKPKRFSEQKQRERERERAESKWMLFLISQIFFCLSDCTPNRY